MLSIPCNIDKDEWFVEWCQTEFTRSGFMVPLSRIESMLRKARLCTGYSTHYVFNKEDAKEILERGSSRGLNKYAVGSEYLVVDLDDGEKQLQQTETILQSHGLEYYVFLSGGKGFHIYIPQTEFLYSKDLPYSHKAYIEYLGIDCDGSLYQHSRLLSLEGRVHKKTKVKKQFVKHVKGDKVAIPIIEAPTFSFDYEAQETDLSKALLRVVQLAQVDHGAGNRHTALWSTSTTLLDLGLSEHTVYELMYLVNNSWSDPKEANEVLKAVKQGVVELQKRNG